MNANFKKQLYAFELDDYAAPSCTSFTKTYFGTIDDFKAVLDVIGDKPSKEELHNTFERFVAGERKIIYHAGQCVTRFAKPAKVIKEQNICFERINYTYENSYGFYYYLRMSKAEGKVTLVKFGKKYLIIYILVRPIMKSTGQSKPSARKIIQSRVGVRLPFFHS